MKPIRNTLKSLENGDTIGGRIAMLVRAKGLRINELADKIGISGQGLRDILSGKSKSPKADVMIALSRELEVSTDWLLHGDASGVLNEPSVIYGNGQLPQKREIQSPIPYISLRVQAAFIAYGGAFTGLEELQRFTLPASLSASAEMIAFEVDGDSTYPELKPGSVVICSAETGDLQYLRSGAFYTVLYSGQLTVARLNNKVQTDKVIELQTSTGDFSPIRVRVSDIQKIYRVHMVLQRI